MNYPETAIKEILDNIFGVRQSDTFCEGLVDSVSEQDIGDKLMHLDKRWKQLQEMHHIENSIYEWFVHYKVPIIKATMIKNIREEACLGVPPEPFTTNASETINSVIKSHVEYKKSQLTEFIAKLRQYLEVGRAVIGRGKYKFKEEYAHLEVEESKWFKMDKQQCEVYLQRVTSQSVSKSSPALLAGSSLPIDAETVAETVSIPLSWKKAEELVFSSQESISSAPGHPTECKMVASRSGKRPHLVVPGKGGQYKCDEDCLNFKSLNICSHTVAVAHFNGKMAEFLAWFEKAKKKPNITNISVHGMPTGRGRKGSQAPRKRQSRESITNRVDRFQDEASTSNFVSMEYPGSVCNISAGYYCGSPYNYNYMPYACLSSVPHSS